MIRSAGLRFFALGVVVALAGCGSPPQVRTTFLNSVDLVNMTDRMAQSFAADAVIGGRGPQDQPWVVSIDRVVNHTNQIIPENQKWLYIGRLRAQLDEGGVGRERTIIWVIPPERWPIVARELGVSNEPHGLRMPPSHLLTAAFSALTNTSGRGRSDMYLCAYELIDLDEGRVVWSDSWEVKRAAMGRTYD